MANTNMADKQCCDLDIRDYKTEVSWLCAGFCNTTTMGLSSEPAYASKKGQKCIKFDNPLDGIITMTFQVHPLKVYAMLGDDEVEASMVITRKGTTTCATAGSLTLINVPATGTAFVYAKNDFGGRTIEGAAAEKILTVITDSESAVGTLYVVGYLEKKESGVKKVSFNNRKVPKGFYIQVSAPDKNKDGELVLVRTTAYKAGPQRGLDLSFSSDDDPVEITITCNALVDDNDNVLDMVEISNEAEQILTGTT